MRARDDADSAGEVAPKLIIMALLWGTYIQLQE